MDFVWHNKHVACGWHTIYGVPFYHWLRSSQRRWQSVFVFYVYSVFTTMDGTCISYLKSLLECWDGGSVSKDLEKSKQRQTHRLQDSESKVTMTMLQWVFYPMFSPVTQITEHVLYSEWMLQCDAKLCWSSSDPVFDNSLLTFKRCDKSVSQAKCELRNNWRF